MPAAQAAETPERGLFVSVIQNPPVLSGRQDILDLVDFASRTHVQTLFVQVYREGKAWFPSRVGDSAPYDKAFQDLSEDPFALLIREAHAKGIQVHAWLNLLSLGLNAQAPLLEKYGPEILARNKLPKVSLTDYRVDNHFFLEPGDPRVQQALSVIIGEVVGKYPELDGVQFDYIRYPDVHPDYGYATANVERYKMSTGHQDAEKESSDWKKWKCAQVTGLVERLAKKARRLHPGIQVSTTGLVPYSRAKLESFQDWRAWIKNGTIDFVTLMAYPPTTSTYKRYLRDAKRRLETLDKANFAVGAYKLLQFPATFESQWRVCEESGVRACVIFHYGSLLENSDLQKPLMEPKT